MLGASGLQTAALPTAILSTHTGGFGENTFLDLSASLPDIWAHWDKEKISFDAIYLGYLGQAASRVWEKGLEEYSRQGKFILLDSAMADHGRLYRGCHFVRGLQGHEVQRQQEEHHYFGGHRRGNQDFYLLRDDGRGCLDGRDGIAASPGRGLPSTAVCTPILYFALKDITVRVMKRAHKKASRPGSLF
ncbi:hypothetical protein FD23_GL001374 [Lactobacillus delbrueckii subsp. delbrueckii DSM 20074 = JCM 1012]|nr:hypothetical protein FD23_GL001374 [Lactobacillus delbrueckii subsp. delbrueckii DSM 20074 = JCM 1012]